MSGIIGRYIGMSSVFDDNTGRNTPCSIIKAGPCSVIQIKTVNNEGYNSVQLGFEDNKKFKKITKPLKGHFKKFNSFPKKKIFEFKCNFYKKIKNGDEITLDLFKEGEFVNVIGFSKGKGFQGVVKRYGFSGVGEKTHGQHNRLRAPGSIGAGSDPSRVFKGTRMGGRMGNNKVTVKNLKVLKLDLLHNILVLKGSVPGCKNSYIIIKR